MVYHVYISLKKVNFGATVVCTVGCGVNKIIWHVDSYLFNEYLTAEGKFSSALYVIFT